MKLLIIGGTLFVGRHLVEAAQQRGHELTLFNRGQRNPGLFPDVERLIGDRDGGLDALKGRQWDAVIDTCGYHPLIVRQSAERLAGQVGNYAFISTISVYPEFPTPGMTEDAPLARMDKDEAEKVEKITNENYGAMKVLCEAEVEKAHPGTTLLVRPGMIVGPHDPSDRFTYWPARAAKGGDVLVPGSGLQRFQMIDVRDLAEWTLTLVENGKTGAYNATGPDYPLTMHNVLDACKAVSKSDARFHFVPGEFLKVQGFDPHTIHAWYLGEDDTAERCVWELDCGKAITDGLTYRTLETTVRDTLLWEQSRPADEPRRLSLDPVREGELLRLWEARIERPNRVPV